MRRDNGLEPAASYVPLADVDPPLSQHVLDVLRDAGVAAYAEPLAGETGPYRDVRPPPRPTLRVFVDRARVGVARAVVDGALPRLRADFLADAAARDDADGLRAAQVDAAWAAIVAGWDHTVPGDAAAAPDAVRGPPPDGQAPSAGAGDHDGPPAQAPGAGGGLSRRLVRRSGADEPADDPVEHFVPPAPPPLPATDPVTRFAWLGVLAGPALLVLTALAGLDPLLGGVGVVAFLAGFVTLVARMPDRGADDDPDDGAVV